MAINRFIFRIIRKMKKLSGGEEGERSLCTLFKEGSMTRKKTSKKRLLAMMLSLALLVAMMPANIFAAENPANEALAGQETGAEAAEPASEEAGTEAAEPGAEETAAPEETNGDEAAPAEETLSENGPAEVSEESSEEAAGDVVTIEVNQGFSYHTGLNDGNETYLTTFVAKKTTAVMMKIPGSDSFTEEQAKQAVANYTLQAKAVVNGQESDNNELSADKGNFEVKQVYDKDCDVCAGWYAIVNFPTGPDKGTYNFHIKDGDNEVGKLENVTFYETKNLNILVVPVNAYWSKKYDGAATQDGEVAGVKDDQFYDRTGNKRDWSDLCGVLKEYMLDVYPIADVTFEEGQEIQANDASYDMCNEADKNGQKKLWDEVCKLQSKTKDGKDRYDLILAFVRYRQDQGAGQGYTFGKPTNIITYRDKDMLPTVAHEIAHCYQVGDEYNGGSFNTNVNMPPNNYSGRNYVTGENIAKTEGAHEYWKDSKGVKESLKDGEKKNKIQENGAGTMVSLGLRPYSLSKKEFIRWAGVDASGNPTGDVYPVISWMGSGFQGCDGYYFTSSVIWDHLLKELVVKEKKEASQEQGQEENSEQSNAQVFENAINSGVKIDEYSIFDDEDDFYYDDDYRFGESRMVEVNGWLSKAGGSVSVNMSPMFSYDGDLETIDPLEDIYKGRPTVYTFAALNSKDEIVKSPVDKKPSAVSFNGSFFNPGAGKSDRDECNFNFDAEYPEGTTDFIIVKGSIGANGEYDKANIIWQATKDKSICKDEKTFSNKIEGYLNYAEVNDKVAEVEWDVYYPADNAEEPYDNKNKDLYTEVYYCPEGDDGESYYAGCSDDKNWTEGYIKIDTTKFKTKWTRNAYVWIKVTNGVNAVDIYSDENDVTLCNSTITLKGAGIKATKGENNETEYSAVYTGKPIVPNTSVTARDPETGKNIPLTKDVDYTVTYKDNVEVGYASVIVQGIGIYAGKNTQEFEITKKSFAKAVPDNIPDVAWDKAWGSDAKKLDAYITRYISATDEAGNTLVYNKDFTVKFTADGKNSKTLSKVVTKEPESGNSIVVGVEYTGKGCFEGKCNKAVNFEIFSSQDGIIIISDNNAQITLKAAEFQYTGKPVKPAVTKVVVSGNDGKIQLKKNQYKVVYSNNVGVGTGRVRILGKNGYTGSFYTTFTINPKKVTSLTVAGVKNQPYTGKAVSVNELPIVVKAGGIVLTKDVDYRIVSVNGSDYTNVTKKGSEKPALRIELIEAKAGTKSSQMPKVVWKNGSKSVEKKFSIIKTKLNSAAVTFSLSSNVSTNNVIKDPEGKEKIGIMRAATKDELNTGKRKYTYVIEGVSGNFLPKNAVISSAGSIKAYGVDLDPALYDITVSKTNDGKNGTITYKAKNSTSFTGKKTIKFRYINTAAETE